MITEQQFAFVTPEAESLVARYAIGYAERLGPRGNIGWLSSLANATNQPYTADNKGGPSIKVRGQHHDPVAVPRQVTKLLIVIHKRVT